MLNHSGPLPSSLAASALGGLLTVASAHADASLQPDPPLGRPRRRAILAARWAWPEPPRRATASARRAARPRRVCASGPNRTFRLPPFWSARPAAATRLAASPARLCPSETARAPYPYGVAFLGATVPGRQPPPPLDRRPVAALAGQRGLGSFRSAPPASRAILPPQPAAAAPGLSLSDRRRHPCPGYRRIRAACTSLRPALSHVSVSSAVLGRTRRAAKIHTSAIGPRRKRNSTIWARPGLPTIATPSPSWTATFDAGWSRISPFCRSSATTRNTPAAAASRSSPMVAPTLWLPFSASDNLDFKTKAAQITAEHRSRIAGFNSRQHLGDVLVPAASQPSVSAPIRVGNTTRDRRRPG